MKYLEQFQLIVFIAMTLNLNCQVAYVTKLGEILESDWKSVEIEHTPLIGTVCNRVVIYLS